ncbi:MAG: cardiolipin synthase [Acetatifactor sp.]|nr:cardiolipin synthase [Acetatifactor sp.]
MREEEGWRKGLGNLQMIIYGRTFVLVLGFLLQLLFLIEGYVVLRNYSLVFYAIFVLIGVIAILYIYNHRGNPDMKLAWMFPIAVFPIFGAVFYMTILFQPGSKILKRRLSGLSEKTEKLLPENAELRKRLREENPHMAQLAYYLYKKDNSPVYENTTVTYYALGDNMFPDMVEELKKAKKFIFLEYFIISEGELWETVLEILKEKAGEGVEVRVMYDGTNVLFQLPGSYPKKLRAEGIQCELFAPIKLIFSSHYNNRDHRKICVIDGEVAFTGGINLADEYINRREKYGHWKDVGVRLKGSATARFTCMFLEMWNAAVRGKEDFEPYLLRPEITELSDGYVIPYSSNPLGEEMIGESVYLDMINTAHTYVHIMTPYLILDHRMLSALRYSAMRGVEVCILMPHVPDKKMTFALAKTYYRPLMECGVRIYEYTPGFVHAKVFSVDGVKAVVGTVNLDYRSLYHHFECGVILYRNSQIAAIEKDYRETLEKSQLQTLSMLEERSVGEKLRSYFMRIIAPLL